MFSELISRNNRRSRKENGLFFSSLLISIIAFYIILSLSHQDVMLFLAQMESNAVDKLMMIIPVFYCLTLVILFFLIYYASKYQLERRRHEFGVYLMLGMRRIRLFVMLLTEDLCNSILALGIGLPAAVLLSELTSLITARLVGIGIIGRQTSFSLQAVLWTAVGFILIKSAAFLILSGRISRQEIGTLLVDAPEGLKRQLPPFVYGVSVLTGILCLAAAYYMAISGSSWMGFRQMGLTVLLGLTGTFLFFWGLRFPLGFLVNSGKKDRQLKVFNFRQLQETVIHRSGTLAVCSLLVLAALCCFGTGTSVFRFYGESESHVLDYTFTDIETSEDAEAIRRILSDHRLDTRFRKLFEVKTGYVRTAKDRNRTVQLDSVMDALRKMPSSPERDVLLNNLQYNSNPHLIALSGYNRLLSAAGLPELELADQEAAVYIDSEFITYERREIYNRILETKPEIMIDQETFCLTGTLQTTPLVTDRAITLSFALILPDDLFEFYTQGVYDVYLNGILTASATEKAGLMSAIMDMNQELDKTGLSYESYLQNMARQLFYMVSVSYITIYLAVIFLIVANTFVGVQFLMSQQNAKRRYRTLIRLGATHTALCRSSHRQVNWYFGLPVTFAAFSCLFGVRSLFTGVLPDRAKSNLPEMMIVSASIILVLCVIEYIYIAAVKRANDRYLLTLMVPEREE